MATEIGFVTQGTLTVAQELEDVVSAVRRTHPNPIPLESTTGGRVYVNWEHVVFIAEVLEQGPGAAG